MYQKESVQENNFKKGTFYQNQDLDCYSQGG